MLQCTVLQGPRDDVVHTASSLVLLEWLLQNTGPIVWPAGCEVREVADVGAGANLGRVIATIGESVAPGCTVQVGLEFVAPEGPATIKQRFALVSSSGSVISSELHAELLVARSAGETAEHSQSQGAHGSEPRPHPFVGVVPGSHTRALVRSLMRPCSDAAKHAEGRASSASPCPPVVTTNTCQEHEEEWLLVESDRPRCGASPLQVDFTVNGKKHSVKGGQYPLTLSLAEYLRYECGLVGTKIGCGEGGCGACTVLVRLPQATAFCVANSCLRLLHSLGGADVLTIEHIGTPQAPHTIQKAMVDRSASQCGMCTPGMVMAIYGHQLKADSSADSSDRERCIQGNLCRCTGYRPIYDVIHKVASAGSSGSSGSSPALHAASPSSGTSTRRFAMAEHGDKQWIDCTSLDDVFAALPAREGSHSSSSYRLVVGNTGHGVAKYYAPAPEDSAAVIINIENVPELLVQSRDEQSVTFGAACTLASLITTLEAAAAAEVPQFAAFVKHLKLVAHPQVRNVASWAGNVMLAKLHRDFPSDVCLLLCLYGAVLTLASADAEERVAVLDFLKRDAGLSPRQIIKSVNIPIPRPDAACKSFKIMRRKMNAHAEVNLGVLLEFSDAKGVQILSARVLVGNIVYGPLLAEQCVKKLAGQTLSAATIEGAMQEFAKDVAHVVDPSVAEPAFVVSSKDYRQSLAKGVLYKALLQMLKERLGESALTPAELSAAQQWERPESSGTQKIPSEPSKFAPLGKPQPKYQALEQTCGAARYTADLPLQQGTLFGVPVLAKQLGELDSVDAGAALKVPGVAGFLAAEDVTKLGGKNFCQGMGTNYPVFAAGSILHVGQFVGMVVATSFEAAREGARLVLSKYKASSSKGAVLGLEAASTAGIVHQRYAPILLGKGGAVGSSCHTSKTASVKGGFSLAGQKHMYLECQSAYVVPRDDGGFVVNSSMQMTDFMRASVAQCLNVPMAKIDVRNTRVGGAYGGKVFYAAPTATAAALAVVKFKHPVMVLLDRNDDSLSLGGRNPVTANWSCTFDAQSGAISALTQDVYAHAGFDKLGAMVCSGVNCYQIPHATLNNHQVVEHKPLNTTMRAPGEFEQSMVMESIVEGVVRQMKVKDPIKVQEANLDTGLWPCWGRLKDEIGYAARRASVDSFNGSNVYQKQGLWCMGTKYAIHTEQWLERCQLVVHNDGSVTLQHSGIEMGQGIDTKAIQACAEGLLEAASDFQQSLISVVLPKDGGFNSGCMGTFGSGTSETVVAATLDACAKLTSKLEPYRSQHHSWKDLVAAAFAGGAELTAVGEHRGEVVNPASPGDTVYYVYAAAAAHVQVDMLLGQVEVLSFDIVYDAGNSLNPTVDVGQIEGSVVQALGICLMEETVFSDKDGRIVNNGTWDYKVPSGLDIPVQLNVTLLERDRLDPTPAGIIGSKATGEPAYLASGCTFWAVKDAVAAARADPMSKHHADPSAWFQLDVPASGERILQATGLLPPAWA